MARLERFELPTARFVAEYSIQLSYRRLILKARFYGYLLHYASEFDQHVIPRHNRGIQRRLNAPCPAWAPRPGQEGDNFRVA